ncbi:YeeE/YedE family protein [Qipengyuania sphaerica]|uniref:YeeE/YedE family protein n=1 Tax=Qipengyuania sphaerica TaxID=2867243 RepID=UPI001C88BE61|nr:YeeE/YedE thiosulfate transporter family protein [Qipengyuania sphaerica]MBX7539672.1 YeeE/YedE family protein [Qipengyuania sphaerica]
MSLPGFPQAAPIEGLAGGVLIGIAAAVMLLGAGRIVGVSGIVGRAFRINASDLPMPSAWLFLAGMPAGAAAIYWIKGGLEAEFASIPMMIAAGLLVGLGARMGSGCTSGHGVCGVSRLSQRSIVATATFIAAGIATVAVLGMIA